MADITKITDAVLNDARSQADAVIAAANEKAGRIIAQAEEECVKIAADGEKTAQTEAKRLMKRLYVARQSRRRDKILKAKQEILDELYVSALSLISEPDGKLYHEAVSKLFKDKLHEGNCVIYLPEKCKNDSGLLDELKTAADEKGCVYSVSYGRKDVKTGFIAAYGGIEENCTFESLFSDKAAELSDMASRELFQAESEDGV